MLNLYQCIKKAYIGEIFGEFFNPIFTIIFPSISL